MSSTIVHSVVEADAPTKHPFLVALGDSVRQRREQRGLSRKALSAAAGVSERHLANLEYGLGNASVLVLLHVAQALRCSPAELLDGGGRGANTSADSGGAGLRRIALVGLRGAGKSTLGRLLAEELGFAFVELSREIERVAACSISEIQALYGQDAYRRYERRALEESVGLHTEAVIATPGGLVTDAASHRLLLAQCHCIWLRARPEDHLQRVAAQGDLRPMAASAEALQDLKAILASRAPFYAKAPWQLDTSAQPLDETFTLLGGLARQALAAAAPTSAGVGL